MSQALLIFEQITRRAKNVGQPEVTENEGVHPFDERNIHPDIARVSIRLFDDGHYAQATFEAFKYIENQVKHLSGIDDAGFNLMMNAFNETGPKVKLTDLATMSDKDEQRGFRYIFAGAMSGIRNPRGHDNRIDPIELSLDHLSIASVLLRTLGARITP
jgi:uncharacterized protein (TIGR02391 family)